MIKRKKATGLAGILTGVKVGALASVIYLTGNLLPNTNLDETRSIVDNNVTNTVTSTGPIENHSRYWRTGAIADSWVNVFQGTNLVDSVQADSSGNYFFDSYGTNGAEYIITYNVGGTNILDGGTITHNSGGTFEVTNNIGETVASDQPLEIKSISNDSSNIYFSWNTHSGVTYNITSSTNLSLPSGGFNQTNHTYSATNFQEYTYSEPITKKQCFYRVEATD